MDTNYKIEVKIDIKATNETQAIDIQGNNDSFSIKLSTIVTLNQSIKLKKPH